MPSGGAVRKAGAGRKRTVEQDATLVRDLERLIEPLSRGDPESPLRWTCKSVCKLAQELGRRGHRVSHRLATNRLGRDPAVVNIASTARIIPRRIAFIFTLPLPGTESAC